MTSCIKRVTDILDLKACTDGVTEALKEEDYESVITTNYNLFIDRKHKPNYLKGGESHP